MAAKTRRRRTQKHTQRADIEQKHTTQRQSSGDNGGGVRYACNSLSDIMIILSFEF